MIRSSTPSPARAPQAALLAVALFCAPAGPAFAQTAALPSGIDRTSMDGSVRMQDDAYLHANGTWIKNTPIPPDKAEIGATEQLWDKTQGQLRGLIEAVPATGASASARKTADLYAAFMDEAALEKLGARPLADEFAAIDAIDDRSKLAAAFGRLDQLGAAMPINSYINQDDRDSTRYVPQFAQGGLGLPDRDYYLVAEDAKFKEVRAQYAVYLAKLLVLSGQAANAQEADTLAASAIALETEIARAQWTNVQNRDPVKTYNRYEVSGLSRLGPTFDWNAYLGAVGVAGKSSDLLFAQPSYMAGLDGLVQRTPLATWKLYAKLRLLSAYAAYLSKDFVDARFAFVGKVLSGRTENLPRWKRGVLVVDGTIGEALGQVYVDKYFPPETKARMDKLVANLFDAYRRSIDTLTWMSPATRKQAQAKLAKFGSKIGYPKRWIDYSALDIRPGDLVGNLLRAHRFEWARQLAKLGQPIDRDEWLITPQTINAYYNPPMNEIVFPAAFLQPPMFDVNRDEAANYGAIGAVIGHEISHGFDDSGSQYDGDGNLRDWWTKQDRARFKKQTARLVAQYNGFEPVPGYKINGELTLGENIADNSGLEIAYKAYHLSLGGRPAPVIDGLSGDTRFFYGWAQAWASKRRPEATLRQIKSDPHSPDEFRVNGALQNHPAYYTTFGVKPTDKMYLPPAKRVSIW